MRITLILIILFTVSTVSFSATINIPADYATIQAGIDAANTGDTVLVAPGAYIENIDFKGKAITVRSSKTHKAIIDGNQTGSVVSFHNKEGLDSVLEGFVLKNGTGSDTKSNMSDGIAALGGGGVFCLKSSPTVINNMIQENGNNLYGGGVYCSGGSPIIKNNIISNNTSCFGGGISCEDSPTIINNIIKNNSAKFSGGGISCSYSTVTIANNIVYKNHSDINGGINISCWSTPIFTNNTVYQNLANKGGGLGCGTSCILTISNSIFWRNCANQGKEILINSTIFPSTLTIHHSNLTGGKSSIFVDSVSTLNWGAGMIDSDPSFVDPENCDFHLTYLSPCRNSGDNSAVVKAVDFEGDPRIAFKDVDMGADEFHNHLYYMGAPTPGWDVTLKFIGNPGATPVGYFMGGSVLNTSIPSIWGEWHLGFPITGPIYIRYMPADGVKLYTQRIPITIAPLSSIAMQGFIGMELTNLCNIMIQ